MKIDFPVPDSPAELLYSFGQSLGVKSDKQLVAFSDHAGEGYMKHYELFKGLTLKFFHFRGNEQIELIRTGSLSSSLIIVLFYSQEQAGEMYINEKHGTYWLPYAKRCFHAIAADKYPLDCASPYLDIAGRAGVR